MMNKRNIQRAALFMTCAVILSLPACKTTSVPVVGKSINSLRGMHDETEERLSTIAANSVAEGKTQQALAQYEKLYYNRSADGLRAPNYRNEDVALNYAQLLRKTGNPDKAREVLAPLVETRTGDIQRTATPVMINELAAINIELGDLARAEDLLNRVLEDKKAKTAHADAYNLLGIVLDAQGNHKQAEEYFRQSLDMWKGDSTSVMNNLAVSLASQGRFDDSILTLRQALMISPHKQEVARNIDLVTEIRKSMLPKPAPTAPVSVTVAPVPPTEPLPVVDSAKPMTFNN